MARRISEEIRQFVYQRAKGCCEYCQTCEINTGQTMQIDHINPNGTNNDDNLCLSCWNCNNYKRASREAFDPQTGLVVQLYDPRRQVWHEHFLWHETYTFIIGLSPNGRATVEKLKLNRPSIMAARKRWGDAGYHPPR
jgi:hypothetical protein